MTVAHDTDSIFRKAFESLPQPMALSKKDGVITALNRRFSAVFDDRLAGGPKHLADLVGDPADPTATADTLLERFHAAGPDGVAVTAKDPAGGVDDYVWRVTSCEGIVCLFGSNRSTVEETSDLRLSQRRLSAILVDTVDGVVTIDASGYIQSFNGAAERIFGYAAAEVLGKNVHVLMPAPYRDEHDDYIQNYLDTGIARIIGIGREVVGRRKDGTHFPMDLAVSEVTVGGRTTFTGIIRDITLRRELEKEILRIGDEERRRIGQDLHDELGQTLTGIGLMAQNLARRLEDKGVPEADDLKQITRFIRDADQYARTLARGLVPVELDGNGLPAALLRLAGNASTLFGIQCTFNKTGPVGKIDPAHGMHLFRIAQEALSNAARHGNASNVKIELTENDHRVRLRIEDDGSGFDREWDLHGGSGVRIMRYRANIIGGSLDISESVSGGTVVGCTIPLNNG